MPNFRVLGAEKKKDVPGQHGPMQVIGLALGDDAGNRFTAEWFTKATTPIPGVGTSLEGTVEDSQYGKKFKRSQNGFGGGGPRPEDPVRAAKIMRMHSQEMALRYINAKAAAGKLPEDFSMTDLRTIIDWFDADAVSTTQPQQQGATR